MSDRLKDLQRQRALAQEQLAWLDREIARESSGQTANTPAPVANQPKPVSRPAIASVALADDIITQYQQKPDTVRSEVKRGCFLYFFAALAVVGLGLLALYLLKHR